MSGKLSRNKSVMFQKVLVRTPGSSEVIGSGYIYYLKSGRTLTEHFALNELEDTTKILQPGNYNVEFVSEVFMAVIPERVQ